MKNFEVGERVQFTCNGKIVGLGIITEIGENTCIVESEGNQRSYLLGKSEIAKLDQPASVEVPEAIGTWLRSNEEHADLLDNYTEEDALADTIHHTIYGLFANFPSTNPDVQLREPVLDWLCEDRRNYFKLVDAVRNGYVVEEEQKYYVKFPGAEFPVFLVKTDDGGILFWSNTEAGTKFTEQEIKKLDKRYWSFAVPVEEVEVE